MRAPIYNDRGQFRYSDFVAYMPDFLKTEPDVVTLLQVFSDYINNAYRNIDTVERFEFAIVSRSSEIGRAVDRMDYLRTMLDLAGTRNDYVNLLSVPRANVKSNAVFGEGSGISPFTVNYGGDRISERIDNASSVVPCIDGFSDGDVIFVNYEGIPGETEHEVAYYYDAAENCLFRDPAGKSQDPFTGTDNSSGRILSFRVSDVSTVKTRYGYTTDNGTQYKEVFFTARIYDVRSNSSVKKIELPGGQAGIIDYYGTEHTPSGSVRTTVRFDGERGWAWRNGYPTAIIYLSETSGAGVSSVRGAGKDRLPLDMCVDPSYAGTLSRYSVIGVPEIDGNILTVRMGTSYPAYAGGTVYLAVKRDLRILGEFTVLQDDRESGVLDLRLAPVGRMPDLPGDGELVLLDLPLFYGRGSLDYATASPIIRLGRVMDLDIADEDGLNLVPGAGICSYACETYGNPAIGELSIVQEASDDRGAGDAYLDGGYRIVVPFSSGLARNFGKLYDLGDRIYVSSGHGYWKGLAIVKEFSAVEDGYSIKLEGIGAMRPSGLKSTVSVARAGYFRTVGSVPDGTFNESMIQEDGSPVVLSGTAGKVAARMYPDGRFDRDIPDDTYTLEILRRTEDRARSLLQVDRSGDSTMTVWERSRGDLFTRPYMMLSDGTGNMQVAEVTFKPGEEVVKLVSPGEYHKGQYVYDGVSKKVYLCGEDCRVQDVNSVSTSGVFAEDRIVHYSIPYTEKYNSFMPYYGPVAAMEYGSTISYSDDPEVFSSPLYITKVEEKTLKYGWEHREFLNYGDTINMSGRPRNGMVEFHTTERTGSADVMTVDSGMDIVNSDLFSRCRWSYPHNVVARGCSHSMPVDIDDPVVLCAMVDPDDGKWKVTVHSAAHGLVDGSVVSVSGIPLGHVKGMEVDFNAMFVPVEVIDGDTFSYPIEVDDGIQATACFADRGDGKVVYIQDHNAPITSISSDTDGNLTVMFGNRVHGPTAGDMVYIEGCTVDGEPFPNGPYEVVTVNSDFSGISVKGPFEKVPVPAYGSIVRVPIADGDVVAITDASDTPTRFYRVGAGPWEPVGRNSLITPLELYSQANLFDVSITNPSVALGDGIRIKEIIYDGDGKATVHLAEPLLHFNGENRKYIEGKTVVRIVNVTPSDFNGYHVVTSVNGPTSFCISMRMYNGYTNTGVPTGDLEMTLFECRWYRYTLDEIEWDKVSSQATFTGRNGTVRIDGGDGDLALMCEYDHGLVAGDHVVLGHAFDEFDETTGLAGFAMGRVTGVAGDRTLTVELLYGTYANGMSIARGIIALPGRDNLQIRNGEYSMALESIGGLPYRFTDGDIVIAAGQAIPAERLSYLVRKGVRWSVLKRKRVLKVRRATVDEYRNSYYMDGNASDGTDEYKYATYSDVDVAMASGRAYASRMYMVRNPVFTRPAIDGMDTTRDPNAEYSSGDDYANVAPRDGMKASFRGVPDMKYPLVEKIERLAYLRDASVIDFDLIGYLARFMGYDITPMADDVQTSNLHRTGKQQEDAIRDAVRNLPQYYSLGGTDAGLRMLMGTFGVICDVLTLYTNTMHPYGELLSRDEVAGRLDEDTANGTVDGTWVSTPYIDIAITDDSRYPQFAIQQDDIRRIREQIRVWKPINVVFRDVLLRYAGEIELNQWISGPVVGIGEFGVAVGMGSSDETIDPEYADPSLTNCAF